MVDLPLIVWREPDVDWFGDRDALTEGRLWAEREAELRSETDRLSGDLRDNLFGPAVWRAMEPATRTFLASGEAVLRARREDPAFDFGAVAVEYAKAVESELNALLFPLLRRALGSRALADRTVDVTRAVRALAELNHGAQVALFPGRDAIEASPEEAGV